MKLKFFLIHLANKKKWSHMPNWSGHLCGQLGLGETKTDFHQCADGWSTMAKEK